MNTIIMAAAAALICMYYLKYLDDSDSDGDSESEDSDTDSGSDADIDTETESTGRTNHVRGK
jgi:hypothetical protein